MPNDVRLPFDDPSEDAQAAARDSRARAMRRQRNVFRAHPAPTEPMSRPRREWTPATELSWPVPDDLVSLVSWLEAQVDARERFRWALRDSLDELLDGQRTGRWAYQHLSKTEKTYLGTAIEVNLTKEFEIPNGVDLDWQMAGVDVDCKFSRELGGWEIPMEMYRCADHGDRSGKADHPALIVWMNDDTNQWAAGLVRITDDLLRWKVERGTGLSARGYNRDNKRRIAVEHAQDIYWLWGGLQHDLPANLLLQLSDDVRGRILSGRSGQERVNQLFREVQGRIVGRQTVLTVGQQDDAPKRARDARLRLRSEGIVVLGHQETHPLIARHLALPVPAKGEWIAARLKRVDFHYPAASFVLSDEYWAVAGPGDPLEAAPELPRDPRRFAFRHTPR